MRKKKETVEFIKYRDSGIRENQLYNNFNIPIFKEKKKKFRFTQAFVKWKSRNLIFMINR